MRNNTSLIVPMPGNMYQYQKHINLMIREGKNTYYYQQHSNWNDWRWGDWLCLGWEWFN